MQKVSIVLIGGGSCSGKSEFAREFKNAFILEMDNFYVSKDEMVVQPDGSYDFDAPEAVNIAECAQAVEKLVTGQPTTIPVYDMDVNIQDRTGIQTIQLAPNDKFVVIPGIFAFHSPLRELADLKIYIDVPPEIRVARRMLRDGQKGRSNIETLAWSMTVEKNHAKFIEPMKTYADLVIPFSYSAVTLDR